MKYRIFSIPALAASLLLPGLGGCQADMDAPEMAVPKADIEANTTIAELKTLFENKTELVGLKDSATNEHYIIRGRVISSDATGNIYKSLVIQDETAALAFSINQGSMYVDYRLGQEMVVDMTGLHMGYYRGLQQVGTPNEEYNGEPQLGFMAYDYWLRHAQKEGLPENECVNVDVNAEWPSSSMYCIRCELPLAGTDLVKMQSQLVELRNVHFRLGGKAPYATYQESVSRALYNENGDSIVVRNSGYSNFYNDTLPEGTGSVRGILSYYGDSWQLLLRGPEDVLIDGKGSEENPFTVTDALNPDNLGRTGWTAGYIVGSVKAGVSAVSGNDDIIFGSDAEMDNNVVIAADKECRDWAQCMVVELPQRTLMRNYVNLIDHPDNYRKLLAVKGRIGSALNMTAMTGATGAYGTFAVEGLTINPPAENFTTVYSGLEESAATIDWTFENVKLTGSLTRVWSWKEYNGSHYLNGSAYLGSANESLAYAVSPVIDLTGRLEARVRFSHAAKFQTTLRTLCGFAVREEGQTSWTELEIPAWPAPQTWNFSGSGDIDISGFAGKKIQIAFKYGSDISGADTWEIKNLTVEAR